MCQYLYRLNGRLILLLLSIAFGYNVLHAQHHFSVDYGDLRVNAKLIKTKAAKLNVPSTMSITKSRNNQVVYSFSLSSVKKTKIVILNEETGKNVVITPKDGAQAIFELPPFFIEEMRQAALGEAKQYLVAETDDDFSVRNSTAISVANKEVYIPRYFYGTKENLKEALPKDRKIIQIFKEKPNLIPAFPNDPKNLQEVALMEEKMSYYVYMYQLPDGTLSIYDEHFNPENEMDIVNYSYSANTNLQFDLSGNTTGQAQKATLHALNLWSEQLLGSVPIDINISLTSMGANILGGSYTTPSHLINGIFYPSTLANQMLGYNFSTQRDIQLEMNSNFTWYFGLDGNTSGYDWVTIMLHEVTHGLGFASSLYSDGSGRYAYWDADGNGHYTDYPGIFDRQLYQGATGTTCLTDLNQSQREALIISGNLYAGRPYSYLLAANGGNRVKMYAPSTWKPGSSVSHWDVSVNFSNFMEWAYTNPLHTFNTRKIGLMRDLGWETCDIVINNTTYDSDITITGCTVELNNVEVRNGAKLDINASGNVTINGTFEAELGSQLGIK